MEEGRRLTIIMVEHFRGKRLDFEGIGQYAHWTSICALQTIHHAYYGLWV